MGVYDVHLYPTWGTAYNSSLIRLAADATFS